MRHLGLACAVVTFLTAPDTKAQGLAGIPATSAPSESTAAKSDGPRGEPIPHADWRAIGCLGGFYNGDHYHHGGAALGSSFRYRRGPVVAGALLELGQQVIERYYGAALLGGFGLRPSRNVAFNMLGAFGVHSYSGVGQMFIGSGDPGTGGSTPYVGSRLAISYLFGQGTSHFEVGPYADFQDDLSRTRHRYSYPATEFDPAGTGDHIVGTWRLAFGIEIGGVGDVF